jgi:hypothetical protein
MLDELDYDLVARAKTIDRAIDAAADLDFDFAIVDAFWKEGLALNPLALFFERAVFPSSYRASIPRKCSAMSCENYRC